MRLPPKFILRGLLVSGWHDSLLEESDPNSMMKHLHLGLWKILFAQVWELRNKHNNCAESIADIYERNQLLAELHEWRRVGPERLGAHQAYLAECDPKDMQQQQTASLRTRIEILTLAARNWRNSCRAGQKLITQYFMPDQQRHA